MNTLKPPVCGAPLAASGFGELELTSRTAWAITCMARPAFLREVPEHQNHDVHEHVEGVVTNTDWQGDIADVIIAVWMEKLEPGIFITVDEVHPEMAKRGYNLTREELADAMGVVAADKNWEIGMAADGTVQVKPF